MEMASQNIDTEDQLKNENSGDIDVAMDTFEITTKCGSISQSSATISNKIKGQLSQQVQRLRNQGKLLNLLWESSPEKFVGMPGFRSTLTLSLVDRDPIVIKGDWAPKKKDAERSAAAVMLETLQGK